MVKKENSGVLSKRLEKKIKRINKDTGKGSSKDVFRRLIGEIFSQIGKDGRFAQVNLSEGERRHGDRSINKILTELSQLDNMNAFVPILMNDLSNKEKKMALNLLVIIKEKRCGKIKGQVVADGSKQRSIVPR